MMQHLELQRGHVAGVLEQDTCGPLSAFIARAHAPETCSKVPNTPSYSAPQHTRRSGAAYFTFQAQKI